MLVAENLKSIHERIEKAAKFSERDPASVKLIAVSKVQSEERILAALQAGHRCYGENRVQEAKVCWVESGLREKYTDLELHLLGPLQTNKAAEAVALFDVIHTLDREKLARKLANEMAAQGRDLPCFIQVNTGEEPQKSGILPAQLGEFYDYCYGECGLDVVGLMCIPPVEEPPSLHFAFLQKLAGQLGVKELSMGMSGDFEKAIPLGATYVRVGSAVFGERDYDSRSKA